MAFQKWRIFTDLRQAKFVEKKKDKNALSRFDKTSSTLHPELT